LTTWWSPARCATYFGDIVRPDGYGRWTQNNTTIEWFLEYDFGTETLTRLADKLHDYHQLALRTTVTTPLLIWLPTTRRDTTARHALTTALTALDHPPLLPIATTATAITDPTRAPDPSAPRSRPTAPAPPPAPAHPYPTPTPPAPPHTPPAPPAPSTPTPPPTPAAAHVDRLPPASTEPRRPRHPSRLRRLPTRCGRTAPRLPRS